MHTEFIEIDRFLVEDTDSGARRYMAVMKEFEVRTAHGGKSITRSESGRQALQLDDGSRAGLMHNNCFRVGTRVFARVLG